MKNFISRILFPAAVVALTTLHTVGFGGRVVEDSRLVGVPMEEVMAAASDSPDTVKYSRTGYRKRWTKEDLDLGLKNYSSENAQLSIEDEDDTVPAITARDTMKVPDSLRLTDPFRYKYYVALRDSLTRRIVVDSLKEAGDTLDWPKIDSIYVADSAAFAKAKFEAWYNSLSKKEQKRYDQEKMRPILKRQQDSLQAIKDSLQARKDSIMENTPRILETVYLPDSLQYKRIISWSHDRRFHDFTVGEPDTTYNYRFHDLPFRRNDVNATWLGVSGSPVQYYNFFKRNSTDGVAFYEALESWSYSPETLPFINTKTPYTELCYWGTLMAGDKKESDNLHLLTSTNITPALNATICYEGYGGKGILSNEKTTNGNWYVHTNYLGKDYLAHAGFIRDKVTRQENGGIVDNFWIRDTTVDNREIAVVLSDASSVTTKKTFFIDQQYRVPFELVGEYIDGLKQKKAEKKWEEQVIKEYKDTIAARGDTLILDTLKAYVDTMRARRDSIRVKAERAAAQEAAKIAKEKEDARQKALEAGEEWEDDEEEEEEEGSTEFFIGHSSDYSIYTRSYKDKVSKADATANDFYHGVYNYSKSSTADSLRTMRFENKVFVRLQPWADDAIISKLDVGVGDRLMRYYTLDRSFLSDGLNTTWNSFYVYAGAKGQFLDYMHWDAKADYVLLGTEFSDLNVSANLGFNAYPFRRARKSPVSLDFHFETKLDEPDFYQQHLITNHYSWDNNFSKISTTKFEARVAVPHWNLSAFAGYALLANNIYYDTEGIVRQNDTPMSVFSAGLNKNLALGIFHFDHRLLFQVSSNEDVLPLPRLAANARYYLQLNIAQGVMKMQLGADAYWNTRWYSPAWNPALGVFQNQKDYEYNNGPFFDAFMNIQWKRACLFVKYENAGLGWPLEKHDYFSAHHYTVTDREIKVGIYWPFWGQPAKNVGSAASAAASGGQMGGGHSHGGHSHGGSGRKQASN